MREPKIGDVVTIHKWSHAKIRVPQKGIIKDIKDFNRPHDRYQLEIEEDHHGGKNQRWFFDRSDFTIDEKEPILRDREGRPLKKFEVGKWYTNPMYDYVSPTGKFRALYFRVESVVVHKSIDPRGANFNEFVFDAVASANWEKFEDVRITQSNCNYDQEMQLVENPYATDIHQAVKEIIERQHPNNTPFKIGDRVEAIRVGANARKELKHDRISEKGETGVITNIYKNDVEIKLDKDGQYSTRLYSNLKILEPASKVEPVKIINDYYDGPSLVGRYVQAKKDTCYGIKAGEYLLIEKEDPDHWFIEKYLSCTKDTKCEGYLTNIFDIMFEGFVPPSKVYVPLPLPEDKSNIVYWEVVEDILENSITKSSGKPFTHPFIPRGTITWTNSSYEGSSVLHIECNRWGTNFPKELFRILGTSANITTEPTVGIQPVVDSKAFISSTSSTVVVHQADNKPPIKENPSPIRTINTIQTKLKNKNKKVRL